MSTGGLSGSPPTPVVYPTNIKSERRGSFVGASQPDDLYIPGIDPQVLEACRNCLAAAVDSTRAFHGIQDRPLVTNIFGTAHAYVSLSMLNSTLRC